MGLVAISILAALLSEQDLVRAIQANPRDATARSNYAMFLQQQGRTAEALAHFQSALDLNPRSFTATFNFALALLGAGRSAEALSALDKHPAARTADWLTLRGTVLNSLGRHPEAIESYREAVALAPNNADTLYDLIITLLRTEANAEAARFIARGRARFPRVGKMHAAAGALAYATGKNAEAVRAYETAVKLEPAAADFHASLGDVYDATGDLVKAEAAYRRSLAVDATVAAVQVKFGKNQLKRQQTTAAEGAFSAALRLDATNAEAHFQMGKLEAARTNNRAAVAHWEQAVATNPALKEAWYQLSLAYRRAGETEKAGQAAERFRKIE